MRWIEKKIEKKLIRKKRGRVVDGDEKAGGKRSWCLLVKKNSIHDQKEGEDALMMVVVDPVRCF